MEGLFSTKISATHRFVSPYCGTSRALSARPLQSIEASVPRRLACHPRTHLPVRVRQVFPASAQAGRRRHPTPGVLFVPGLRNPDIAHLTNSVGCIKSGPVDTQYAAPLAPGGVLEGVSMAACTCRDGNGAERWETGQRYGTYSLPSHLAKGTSFLVGSRPVVTVHYVAYSSSVR
ncbi:hypothetical protein VTK56DRAFT_6402 [Thermocarpiscus australiensis]